MDQIDGCLFIAASSGEADFADGTAVTGWKNLAQAGAQDGREYSYRAETPDRSQWEEGSGVYSSGGDTLSRAEVSASSNGGSKVNFSAPPRVIVAPLKKDFDDKLDRDGSNASGYHATNSAVRPIQIGTSEPGSLANGELFVEVEA